MLRLVLLSTMLAVALGATVKEAAPVVAEQPKEIVKTERAEVVNSDLISKLIQTALTSQLGDLSTRPRAIANKLRAHKNEVGESSPVQTQTNEKLSLILTDTEVLGALISLVTIIIDCVCSLLAALLGLNPSSNINGLLATLLALLGLIK